MVNREELTIALDRKRDGRWVAVVPELPGVRAYGATEDEAVDAVQDLALREGVEVGPVILAKVSRHIGLRGTSASP
jgi:predicted RNase H-like HicB family nuclease